MKRLIFLAIFFNIGVSLYAQAPQTVCYQAVATDAAGVELQARDISVRATILQLGVNGPVVWQEFHAPITDDFGLFSLNIGEGNPITGLPSFSEIDWSQGPYFLKIEMDQTGGSDFVLMGVSQMLSVPYALYGEKAGLAENATNAENALNATNAIYADTASYATIALTSIGDEDTSPTNEIQFLEYDETSGALTLTGTNDNGVILSSNDADSDPLNEIQQLVYEDNILTISGTGGNSINLGEGTFGTPGASADFSQGIIGQHIVQKMGSFVVPNDKTFFLTAGGTDIKFISSDGSIISHPTTPNMPVFGPNTTVIDCMCTGLLVDYDPNIEPLILNLTSPTNAYTVPAGYILFLKSGMSNSLPGNLNVDGDDMEFLRPNFTRGSRIISFPEGTQLKRPLSSPSGEFVLTGYLISFEQ